MQLKRRQKMQKLHKEIIENDIYEKKERTDALLKSRQQDIKMHQDMHILMRDRIMDACINEKEALRPLTMETYAAEW